MGRMTEDERRRMRIEGLRWMAAKGAAIDAYGSLEQNFARCFGVLLGTDLRIGNTIFFTLQSAHRLSRMLEDVYLLKRTEDEYFAFFKWAVERFDRLAQKRHLVVHSRLMTAGGKTRLMPTDMLGRPEQGGKPRKNRELTFKDVEDFAMRAEYLDALLVYFFVILGLAGPPMELPDAAGLNTEFFRSAAARHAWPPPKGHAFYEQAQRIRQHWQARFAVLDD